MIIFWLVRICHGVFHVKLVPYFLSLNNKQSSRILNPGNDFFAKSGFCDTELTWPIFMLWDRTDREENRYKAARNELVCFQNDIHAKG